MYIHQLKSWPDFQWDIEQITLLLANVRHRQGRLLGRMESLGFQLQELATLKTLTMDVVKSSEIEGEILDTAQVRSSIAQRLGIEIGGLVPIDRNVEGIVEMMLDATQQYKAILTDNRLFGWHASLFPVGGNRIHKFISGAWRNNSKSNPMQVVSGVLGREKVHFQAPDSDKLKNEMEKFLQWFNSHEVIDPVLKAAIAHLWFITIHPFSDGNGRIARAITDMQLARADGSPHRFYSMSAQIRTERHRYYDILEETQKGTLDITAWIIWFLECLDRAVSATDITLGAVIKKARLWESPLTQAVNDRQKLMLNKLLDGFTGKLTSSKWAVITKTSQDTAIRDIQDLIGRGLLRKEDAGGRSTSYVLSE
ncbi:Fic family protein [Chitinophaga barathri]|uniref:Fic family protein n=1 Tax=Chitinophaga barathri TaxID=1647451 RepID=A0A3N4MFG6_9BACT|nr:Fic family protein [Chitinophaga barathri]RPD42571.1 Fic family protein [Chitinophaga barathri]